MKNGLLHHIYSTQDELKNKIIITIIASLAVNLVATGLSQLIYNIYIDLSVGTILSLISILYFFLKFAKKTKTKNFSGFFIIDLQNRLPISVPRYAYAEHFLKYLKASFVENNNLKRIWERSIDSSKNIKEIDTTTEIGKNRWLNTYLASPDPLLVKEITEYFVLAILSISLEDYFNKIHHSNDIVEIKRDDIPISF